tara:strand:+ start:194 stop:361 length:168 start_codon:yes stop_codon:yes gene_type:complete
MEPFDPAMHYGPNDAGISALSIALVIVGLIFGSWAIGAIYSLITNFFQKFFKKEE